ncbi:hypothetical protein [Anaeroselena agilis]|uniref:Integral membrane protein n=1 Tax=Anaeroselena agilis TaxID=3063788 RepID=A0ABU3NVH7_9FIRM|nr:hypothetical protein [Selenomonadales bacterium 4137-cl]
MSRVPECLSWLLVFPYAYIVYFLGNMVGGSPRTPQAAAVLFWAYLAVYPVAVVVFNFATRRLRARGRRNLALTASLVPYGVLAAAWVLFAAFVGALRRLG